MILFFDTETSAIADFDKRASDPSQPHLVQLAAILTTDTGDVMESHNVIIKPEGWTIPQDVIDIHGITNEIAAQWGIPEARAISLLWSMIEKSKLIVAHNFTFDKFVARIAARRFGLLTDDKDAWWKALPGFCTMRETTALCNLPGKFAGRPKWPKLTEAYQHIFGKSFDGAHDALADVTACKEVYFWLKNRPAAESAGAK
jgi:DNA polymerase-3 subunit epsilon